MGEISQLGPDACTMEQRIPKLIHYCWFGGKPEPTLVQRCIDSWKRHLSDYSIVRWDEQNFNLECNQFVIDSCLAKNWSFVSDYVRLYALYYSGGIYLDTDMEALRSLDPLLQHSAFTGFQNPTGPNAILGPAILGAEKGHPWIKAVLDVLANADFSYVQQRPHPLIITDVSKGFGLDPLKGNQMLDTEVSIYDVDYFYPEVKTLRTINPSITPYTVHHWTAYWFTPKQRIAQRIGKIIGPRAFEWLYKIWKRHARRRASCGANRMREG